jgi:hypothetical protein
MRGCLCIVCVFTLCMMMHSCGYRLSQHDALNQYSTMSVPYVKGDLDGRLTAAIIKKMNNSSKWRYVQGPADLVLAIEMIRNDREYIGYQYDRVKPTAELIDRLIPNEGRRTILVRIKVLDAHKQHVLYGPYEVEASADYDFVNFDTYKDLAFVNQEGVAQSVLTFSLGQLDAQEGGSEAVLSAAYQVLAEKIVDGLNKL